MPRITFEEVSIKAYKTVKCVNCGKRLKRQKKFWQTVSPFNKNERGEIKTKDEIYRELHDRAKKWKAAPVICSSCGGEDTP